MQKSQVPPLVQRELQAEVLGPVYEVLAERLGREEALAIIRAAMARVAEEAGRRAAAAAPDGPSLAHFAACMQGLAMGGEALEMSKPQVQGETLTYTVSRCAYLERYQAMGLPLELGYAISCSRDGAFARGYHPGLVMERAACIGRGDGRCRFRFVWGLEK